MQHNKPILEHMRMKHGVHKVLQVGPMLPVDGMTLPLSALSRCARGSPMTGPCSVQPRTISSSVR